MDACQFFFKSARLARFYLFVIYTVAIVILVSRYVDNPTIRIPIFGLVVLLILFCLRDWRRQHLPPLESLNGIRYQQGQWSILAASQWQPVSKLYCDYRAPWLITLSVIDYPEGKLRRYVIWRDMLSKQQRRLLLVYLSV